MIHKKKKKEGIGAVELLEETFLLLRNAPLTLLLPYYAGSIPFILGFLYFWGDMSRGAFAAEHIGESVFIISILFIWMKSGQAIFAGHLLAYIKGEPPIRWSFRRMIRMIVEQTAIQPTGLLILPVSLLIMVPFGWAYAFYQNVTAYGTGSSPTLGTLLSKSKSQALLFPEQNHILLGILSVFGPVLLFNVALTLYSFPSILQTFLGLETAFKGWSLLNTTFWMASIGVTYLFLDPVIKTLYLLRCFYGDSIHTGEDLIAELKAFETKLKNVAGTVLILFLTISFSGLTPLSLAAEPPAISSLEKSQAIGLSPSDLDRSADKVIQKREFSWRLPRLQEEAPKTKGPIQEFVDTILIWAKQSLGQILRWIGKGIEWLINYLFPRHRINLAVDEMRPGGWTTGPLILLYLFIAVIASILGIGLYRVWKMRFSSRIVPQKTETSLEVNLSREEIKPDTLSSGRWIELARQLIEKDETRLALRAFFLACLAYLAERGTITVTEFKSNRDYENELRRRIRDYPEILSAFSENRKLFERVWYGRDEVTPEIIHVFNGNYERIAAYGDQT